MAKYPLVASSDMPIDMKTEAVDVCVLACEKVRHRHRRVSCGWLSRGGRHQLSDF